MQYLLSLVNLSRGIVEYFDCMLSALFSHSHNLHFFTDVLDKFLKASGSSQNEACKRIANFKSKRRLNAN